VGVGAAPLTQATVPTAQLEAETNRQALEQTTAAVLQRTTAPTLNQMSFIKSHPALLGIIILLLVTAGFWYWRSKGPGAAALHPTKTLAVLPFKTLSNDMEDQYLSFGLTDALITRLSNLRQITVRPTTAVLKYAKAEHDPRTTARELEVEVLLDGRIQRVDDRIRVTVQLLRARDGAPQWAETFDERSRDLLKIQDDISAQVAAALLPQLTGEERQQLVKHPTENAEAYRLYLQARLQWEQRSQEGFKRGLDFIRQALEKDPNYALAHAGLAGSYALFSLYGFLPPREGMPLAKAAAQRALALDETLAEAHVALGLVFTNYDWNWVAAERAFRRASELNPNLPMAHHAYALALAAQGRFPEARAELQRAQQLDPRSLNITAARAWIEHLARADKQALAIVEEALPLNPSFYPLLQQLGQAQARLGRYDAAVRTFQQARQRSGNSVFAVARLGHVYAQAGRRREAEQVLAELKESATRSYGVAWVYLGLGEREQALTWLEKACDEHASEMIYLKTDPLYDDLRQETRFAELLRRVGLAP
jgi:TolB-like protein/Flp pilus assembly protein TadD